MARHQRQKDSRRIIVGREADFQQQGTEEPDVGFLTMLVSITLLGYRPRERLPPWQSP